MTRDLLLIAVCFFGMYFSLLAQAETPIHELEAQLVTATPLKKAQLFIQLGHAQQLNAPEQAMVHFQKAHDFAKKAENFSIAAEALGLLGALKTQKGNFAKALPPYQTALDYWQALENLEQVVKTLLSIVNVYWRMGDYDEALSKCLDALSLAERLQKRALIADSLHQLGIINDLLGNYTVALEHHQRALAIREALDDQAGIADSLNNIGIIHYFLKQYTESLKNYMHSLKIRRDIDDKKGIAKSLNNVGLAYKSLGQHDEALHSFEESLVMHQGLEDKYEIANISNNIAALYIKKKDYQKAIEYLSSSLQLSRNTKSMELIRENYELFSNLYASKNNFEAALVYYRLATKVKDEILNEKRQKAIADVQTKYETEKKELQIASLQKDNEIQQLDLQQQALLRNSLLGGLFFIFILVFVMFNRYRFEKKSNQKLEEANNLISQEKEKSDQLLLNILPSRVANDLKETGKTEPESFENVTVYFSDVVGFTNLSSQLEPKFLIDELNDIFTAFDNIVEKHQCERVKTIGDAYLCVCGMPTSNPHHAHNVVRSAVEIIKYMQERNKNTEIQWHIRIGIHTGKVVGGVVGVKKYIYDVFGDSINTASRMESNSEPMHINISQSTYELVKDDFSITPRGSLAVKGKGEMNMYFVDV